MPQVQRRMLQLVIIDPMTKKASAEWILRLQKLNISGGRIAHFGCAGGSETLALAWVLDACEVFGIDRDISRAETMLLDLKGWIAESRLALPSASQGDCSWWRDSVPGFLKEERFPTFIEEQDLAHPIKPFRLPGNHFDLACCSNLLYQILENQGEEDVKSAVEGMRRVVRLGGWFVADEPDNGASARFKPILEQSNLDLFRIQTYEFWVGHRATTYYCRKLEE